MIKNISIILEDYSNLNFLIFLNFISSNFTFNNRHNNNRNNNLYVKIYKKYFLIIKNIKKSIFNGK